MAYDPAYGYELAVIIQDGMRRMYEEQERVFYYITVMNENYPQPALPEGVGEGILRGMYPVSYTHLRAHETVLDLVCRLLLEKKKTKT